MSLRKEKLEKNITLLKGIIHFNKERKKRAIEYLNLVIELHTTRWKELGIKKYDQNYLPFFTSRKFGECGCSAHTLRVYLNRENLSEKIPFERSSQVDLLGSIPTMFIFGTKENVAYAAKLLGYEPKKFGRLALVKRCKFLINKIKEENKEK